MCLSSCHLNDSVYYCRNLSTLVREASFRSGQSAETGLLDAQPLVKELYHCIQGPASTVDENRKNAGLEEGLYSPHTYLTGSRFLEKGVAMPTGVIDGFLQEAGPVGPYLLGEFISSLWSLGKEETFSSVAKASHPCL